MPASATVAREEAYDPAWLELEAAMGGRKHLSGSFAEKRVQFNALSDTMQALWPRPLVDGKGKVVNVEVEDLTIPAPSSSKSTEIPLRIYRPRPSEEEKAKAPPPVIVWYHGGGWMGGTLDSEHAQCQLIAAGVPAAIVSVDYGLLPENSTAGMLADCVAGFEWAWANAASSRLGGDARRVVVLGGSAGGALAYGVVRELVLKGEGDKCRGAVGVFPVTIHAMTPPDKWRGLLKSYGSELWETAPVVRGVDQNGVLDLAAERSPANDPLFIVKFTYEEEVLKKFPPTYIATSSKDLMQDDGTVLEAALKDVGVPVRREHYEGLPHYFWFFPQLGEKTMRFVEDLVKGVRWVLEK